MPRIMFLNTWTGILPELELYLKEQAKTVDIFCLQEVHNALWVSQSKPSMILPTAGKREHKHDTALFNRLTKALQHTHMGFHTPNMRGLHDLESETEEFFDYGIATFCRYALRPETIRTSMLHRMFGQSNDGDIPASRGIVSMIVRQNGNRFLVAHMHGLWDRRGKIDTPERFLQSRRAAEHIATHRRDEAWSEDLPVIFGGDFNLTSDCQAMQKLVNGRFFGQGGGESLNQKYSITDTRTCHYKKSEREADYVLSSRVLDARLRVDYKAPSDHAALIVDF